MLFILVFVGLLVYSLYCFGLGLWALLGLLPMLLALPFVALIDLANWVKHRKRDAKNRRRKELWRKHTEMIIEEAYADGQIEDVDENGIPYDFP